MSKAAYDPIAKEYKESKQLPFRIHVERHVLFDLLGGVKEKTLLDLACGEGIYSRQLMRLGAKAVTAVDISSEMVALGQQEEKRESLGVEYKVSDARHFRSDQSYDLVLGSYLLNYAKSWEEILEFCQTIYSNLKDGGRFVGFNDNPANRPEDYHRYKRFGFYKTTPPSRKEGDPVTYHIINKDGSEFSFDNYFLSPATYEKAFYEVGFKDFVWHPLRLSPEGAKEFGVEYWSEFLEFPPVIGLSARR